MRTLVTTNVQTKKQNVNHCRAAIHRCTHCIYVMLVYIKSATTKKQLVRHSDSGNGSTRCHTFFAVVYYRRYKLTHVTGMLENTAILGVLNHVPGKQVRTVPDTHVILSAISEHLGPYRNIGPYVVLIQRTGGTLVDLRYVRTNLYPKYYGSLAR